MLITVLVFLLALMILVISHELGHFLTAKKMGVKVEEFGVGLPPRLFGIKIGETLYSVNLLPLGGFVKLYGEEYGELDQKNLPKQTKTEDKDRAFINKKPWQKSLIVIGGVVGNFLLGWLIFSFLATQGIPIQMKNVSIENIAKNSPAAASGLKENDVLLKLIEYKNNRKQVNLTSANILIEETKNLVGQKIGLIVERGGKTFTTDIVPRKNPPKGEGALGIAITSTVEKKYPWYTAPYHGLIEAFNITYQIVGAFGTLLIGLVTFKKQHIDVAGPVGIAGIVGQAFNFGRNAFLEILALLSLNLAIMNILPFPALDGGRLVFVLYEWISKKRPNQLVEQYTNVVGFIILLALAALVTFHDIIKLFKK